MIKFSTQPGSHERQLARRYNNPLFSEQRRSADQTDLIQAQQKDYQEAQTFADEFHALLQDVSSFSGHEETDKILEVKEQIDRLYETCVAISGGHENEKQGLIRLNEVIMNAIRTAAGNDALAIEELEKEQQARSLHLQLLEYPIIVDLLRPDSVIEEDELLPSILSGDIASIQATMSLFDPAQLIELQQQAEALQQHLAGQGLLDEPLKARFTALQFSA